MYSREIRTLILEAIKYPMPLRVAVRLHLAGVTKPQFHMGVNDLATSRSDRHRNFTQEVWQTLKKIRSGELVVDDRLEELAEELPI